MWGAALLKEPTLSLEDKLKNNSIIMEGCTLDSTNIKSLVNGGTPVSNDQISEANCVTIGIASPETIRSWSKGEVKTPETINYRTYKPEKGGLFCEKIFGPVHDWECACGKYKRVKHKGVTCDRCGVEVTLSRVRRERMGHLELAVPVSHVWFYKVLPGQMAYLLDISQNALDKVIYYESWIVIDKGETSLEKYQLLTDEEYAFQQEQFGKDAFTAMMGAEAIEELLKRLDLPKLKEELSAQLMEESAKNKGRRKRLVKRIRLVEGLLENNMKPEWMILHVLPVIPPDLRPLVPLEGGRFATSDLNDLYRRVINRNNRLKQLLAQKTPDVIIRNEKRMLQEAVDALLDNGRHGRAVTGTGNRQLKSLTDMLKGKQGRFRQNLLGKRVDYSGRSVIVVGPELRINQCGLPKTMALVLFEPFIMQKLKEKGYVKTVRNAKKWIEEGRKEVWDILDQVTKGHPILLNRAPTLHRLSIQAFDPILIEGQAIRLHPLVCTAFNADFDGDQMAVHVPLSNEAQLEAKLLMLSPNNIFSPASGKPITTPSQDITLGVYYLCFEDKRKRAIFDATPHHEQKYFNDISEVLLAKQVGSIQMHDFFNLRNPFYGEDTIWGKETRDDKFIVTTCGRCIFSEIWPCKMGFFNAPAGKKELGAMIKSCYENIGRAELIQVLDKLKDLGYEYATWAGFSIGIQDMIVPPDKKDIIAAAQREIENIRAERKKGTLTEDEQKNRSIDVWSKANSQLADELEGTKERPSVLLENLGREEINPVYAMLNSGARGSKDQIRQLAGMRGLMAKPSGEIIENPIIANFREGLTVLEYFISSHGARKGLADTALKTADSGYMTRRLVDVAHDVICVEEDCGTVNGTWLEAASTKDEDKKILADRISGRFSVDEIVDPNTGETLVDVGGEITAKIAKQIVEAGITKVHIRSVLTCEADHGICAKCYGRNLATGGMPDIGDPLGIIAAQSIGEPGTQLTMRTFHVGGTASASESKTFHEAQHNGFIRFIDVEPVKTRDGKYIVTSKSGKIAIEDENENVLEEYDLENGATIEKGTGEKVKKGERFVTWDAYSIPIITSLTGRIEFHDLLEGITVHSEISGVSSGTETVVMDHSQDVHPRIEVVAVASPDEAVPVRKSTRSKKSAKTAKTTKGRGKKAQAEAVPVAETDASSEVERKPYSLASGAHITVQDGDFVYAGDVIAKIPRQGNKRSKDITGGLPRVAELFEARRPKKAAEISKLEGTVSMEKESSKGWSIITVTDLETGTVEEHKIPAGKQIIVNDGDWVLKGQPLTDGDPVLQDMLEICGPQVTQQALVNAVQKVYRDQGVDINDKHIEIIVRQMMNRVRIVDPGSTRFLFGELIEKREFQKENERVCAEGGREAKSTPSLQGITKASISSESFISAASFQNTTHVLTEAAILGKKDELRGFKENVIMGQLIPAGTGYHTVQNVKLEYVSEDANQEDANVEETSKAKKDNESKKTTGSFIKS